MTGFPTGSADRCARRPELHDRGPARQNSRTLGVQTPRAAIAAALLLASAGAGQVLAQGIQIPGLIVSVPPSSSPPSEPATQPRGTATAPPAGAQRTAPATRSSKAAPARSKKPAARAAKPAPPRTPSRSAALATHSIPGGKRDQSIVVLVNDEPITGYEIDQRALLMSMSANIGEQAKANFQALIKQPQVNERLKAILQQTIEANKGKTREQIIALFEKRKQDFGKSLQLQAVNSARTGAIGKMRKKAEEELVEERLKLQAARKINAVASDAQVKGLITNMAQRNKTTPEAMAANFQRSGIDMETMRQRFRATLSWHGVVRRKFGAFVNVTQGEIDNYVTKVDADDEIELSLQRITLPLPPKLSQKDIVRRLAVADGLRQRFTGCAGTANLAKDQDGARFENLGGRSAKSLAEPTRSLAIGAQDGEMLPPNVVASGIELIAVCSRKITQATDKKRTQAEAELEQREYEVLARRYLSDLKREAHIERR